MKQKIEENQKYKIDTYEVSQYENMRVVSLVTILETPKPKQKKVLCHVESLNAYCLVKKTDLKSQ